MNWAELIHDALKLLAVALLVLLNAFFVAAELALVRKPGSCGSHVSILGA